MIGRAAVRTDPPAREPVDQDVTRDLDLDDRSNPLAAFAKHRVEPFGLCARPRKPVEERAHELRRSSSMFVRGAPSTILRVKSSGINSPRSYGPLYRLPEFAVPKRSPRETARRSTSFERDQVVEPMRVGLRAFPAPCGPMRMTCISVLSAVSLSRQDISFAQLPVVNRQSC